VQAQAGGEEAQSLGMTTCMQAREQKWHTRHEDDKLWGAGITNMIAKIMNGVAAGQEARGNERDETKGTDGGGPEASQHADMTREEEPERRQ